MKDRVHKKFRNAALDFWSEVVDILPVQTLLDETFAETILGWIISMSRCVL